MPTLIIYDNEGVVVQQITGSYYIPVGIPYQIEVPEGKRVSKVDVSKTPPQVIYEDMSPSEIEVLKTENQMLQQSLLETTSYLASQDERLVTQEQALLELTTLVAGGNA